MTDWVCNHLRVYMGKWDVKNINMLVYEMKDNKVAGKIFFDIIVPAQYINKENIVNELLENFDAIMAYKEKNEYITLEIYDKKYEALEWLKSLSIMYKIMGQQ